MIELFVVSSACVGLALDSLNELCKSGTSTKSLES